MKWPCRKAQKSKVAIFSAAGESLFSRNKHGPRQKIVHGHFTQNSLQRCRMQSLKNRRELGYSLRLSISEGGIS